LEKGLRSVSSTIKKSTPKAAPNQNLLGLELTRSKQQQSFEDFCHFDLHITPHSPTHIFLHINIVSLWCNCRGTRGATKEAKDEATKDRNSINKTTGRMMFEPIDEATDKAHAAKSIKADKKLSLVVPDPS
jgi:hypothetical protein